MLKLTGTFMKLNNGVSGRKGYFSPTKSTLAIKLYCKFKYTHLCHAIENTANQNAESHCIFVSFPLNLPIDQ